MASAAIKVACTTVGISIAITGTPMLSRFIPLQLFQFQILMVSCICNLYDGGNAFYTARCK